MVPTTCTGKKRRYVEGGSDWYGSEGKALKWQNMKYFPRSKDTDTNLL
jgi:hypothetical protein